MAFVSFRNLPPLYQSTCTGFFCMHEDHPACAWSDADCKGPGICTLIAVAQQGSTNFCKLPTHEKGDATNALYLSSHALKHC